MVNKQEALKLADKVESGRRLSAAEQATLANYTKILENLPTVNALKAGNARNVAAIKDAVSRGVNPGIASSPGGLIPPPPSFDPFYGKVCQGPGVKRSKGLGSPKHLCLDISLVPEIRHSSRLPTALQWRRRQTTGSE